MMKDVTLADPLVEVSPFRRELRDAGLIGAAGVLATARHVAAYAFGHPPHHPVLIKQGASGDGARARPRAWRNIEHWQQASSAEIRSAFLRVA